ncbi:hypothetical protein LAZ67_2003336 [Cordylochernes scorpioides]|uniref:Uncharacterized protein n=1 Tax=Cordylochernes scorpioides TaxID=51811 RepID=A0ABY6K663_9ARAC|nr:hypothetical protein LAZ67_2003336 [Cordylochernes scorpioides]
MENSPTRKLSDAFMAKAGKDAQLEMILDLSKNPEAHCRKVQRRRIFFNLPDEKENYEQTKMALDKYLTPHKNVVTERFKFRQRVQKDDESIDN